MRMDMKTPNWRALPARLPKTMKTMPKMQVIRWRGRLNMYSSFELGVLVSHVLGSVEGRECRT